MSREDNGPDPISAELAISRAEIDRIDAELVRLIAARIDAARQCCSAKARSNKMLIDPQREAAVIRRAAGLARERGLDPEPVRDVFWLLIELARAAQRNGCDQARSSDAARPEGLLPSDRNAWVHPEGGW